MLVNWFWLMVLGCLSHVAADPARGWQAGAAKVKITPEQPMWMSGYAARNRPAEGKQHDLWARALALRSADGATAVLVTLDLCGIDRNLAEAIAAEADKTYGLPRANLMLTVTHTHSGPVVGENLRAMYFLDSTQSALVDAFTKRLHAQVIEVIGLALKHLAPATLASGHGTATFAVNRRNNPEAQVPKLRAEGQLKGPHDHDVPVLAVRDAQERLLAVVFGYACHATVLDQYLWSGDYPGEAVIQVEKDHPGATALFWAGCGGDINPIPRRQMALVEKYGRELADAVATVLRQPLKPIPATLQSHWRLIDLPMAEPPTRKQLLKDAESMNRHVAARAKFWLQEIAAGRSLPTSYPYPIQVWHVGSVAWIALGGEVVVDYALRFKREMAGRDVWVTAYANDVMAYIPSLRVLKEGGYEGGGAMVYYGLPTVWAPAVEETLVAAVKALVMPKADR